MAPLGLTERLFVSVVRKNAVYPIQSRMEGGPDSL